MQVLYYLPFVQNSPRLHKLHSEGPGPALRAQELDLVSLPELLDVNMVPRPNKGHDITVSPVHWGSKPKCQCTVAMYLLHRPDTHNRGTRAPFSSDSSTYTGKL